MKYVLFLILLVVLGAVAFAVYVRMSPLEAAEWHADPFDGARTGKPNDYLIGPGGQQETLALAQSVSEVMAKLDAVATAEPRVTRLAGSPEDGWVTYVQRSASMGYPDVISVKAIDAGEGSELAIWSRARFGYADMGINAARVARWLRNAGLDG